MAVQFFQLSLFGVELNLTLVQRPQSLVFLASGKRRAGGVVWFDFRALCGGPRSQNDYLEIATQFHTVLLSNVPMMPPRLASEARRFTWLIDVLYDRRVKLILSAEVEPEALYTEGPLAHEFPRTISRLHEMQSSEFLALEHRTVDTHIT